MDTNYNPNPDALVASSLKAPQGTPLAPTPSSNPFTTSSPAVDVSSLSGTTPFTLPLAPADTTPALTSTLGSIPTIQGIVNQENTLTPAEQTNKSLLDKSLSLSDQEAGKTAAQTAANTAAGLPKLNAQLTDLNSQITTLKNEATAIPLQIQNDFAGRGATVGGVAPIQAAQLRTNTIKALGLSSLASALQGNIATAQAQADAAVKAQFDPIEAQIKYVSDAIAANKDQMTKEEKAQADTTQAQLAERSTQLGYQRQDMQTAHVWAAAAVTNNPGNQAAQLAAQQALGIDFTQPGALQAAMQLLAPYQSDPNALAKQAADIALTRAQTNSANATANKTNAEARLVSGGGALGNNGLPLSPTDYKNGVPITATGAAQSSNPYDSQGYALATGLAAPSQYLSGRSATTPAGVALTKRANDISMAVNGVPFNPAAAEAMFKFRNSAQYQRLTNNAPVAIQTIVQAAAAAQRLGLTGVKSLNSVDIQTKANGLQFWASDQQKSDAQLLSSFLALNQDDLGLILGAGQGSDYKTKLAGLIFDPTGAPQSTTDLTSSLVNKITDKLGQYYTSAGIPNGKAYAVKTAQDLVNGALGDAAVKTSAASGAATTVMTGPDGQQYNVPNEKVDAFTAAGGHR
jgi:hypothetical protein